MNKVFILWSCDEHHSNHSKNLIGIFTEHHKAVNAADEFDGYNMSLQDKDNLEKINQTQGLEINYMIESRVLNEIN